MQVSEIGYGCMSLGHDHRENAKLLHRALEPPYRTPPSKSLSWWFLASPAGSRTLSTLVSYVRPADRLFKISQGFC